MKSDYLNEIEKIITDMKLDYDEITTWTTDGFFRETPDRVKQFRELGASTVEMECAGMAACAQFRNVDFAQILCLLQIRLQTLIIMTNVIGAVILTVLD